MHFPLFIQELQREFVQDDPILKVTLNYGQYEAYTQKNGIFAFYNIPNGRYFLEIHSKYFVYESAFIDVYTNNKGTNVSVSKIHPISRQKPQQQQQTKQQRIQTRDSMLFEIIQRKDYFEKEDELSLSQIYQNQYFFMIAITVAMLFFVKKMPIEELQSAERAPQQQ
ncbi:unnamed protein product (macronuclear) [Paramecium tetraurelia]|uniref:ER membrane protein complex subunit 7 beta-sandwich domain-containing protein n=1 Tax=Paramecium tetraurelia TaxID=5888 RepID=A0BQA1_PARTE|nr:uncharacterized protein GSPATT00030947001 [Paramecium tetraurelia]CAK60718.1 unnamed protein product [Paramecium tetraurelia]|eukprot:XP_001428116.1 hypothetical protein (macronuclear) [Paramecium tetraurelia strain d4-2]